MNSSLLFSDKRITPENDIIEIKIWKVPKNKNFKEGIKYSLVYIHKSKRILGYDNERGKEHHEHRYDKEKEIKFRTWNDLIIKFKKEVKKLRDELYGNKSKKY